MNLSKQPNLVVCSVIVAPARLLVFYKLRTWLDQIVKVVVHSFAVDRTKLPLDPSAPNGYWYCAGDFCNTDESGVYQHLSESDLDLAKCLVSPDIKDDHPEREQLVISGEYGVHYVCHNITNRVLYATDKCSTLIDLDLKTTGYEIVVKSTLGIYGQNKVEWDNKKRSCIALDYERGTYTKGRLRPIKERTRQEEVAKIHLRACGGDIEKSRNLTDALAKVDEKFLLQTESIVYAYNEGGLDTSVFHKEMVDACMRLFSSTIRIVGIDMTKKIYPGCDIETGSEDNIRQIQPRLQSR